MKIVGDTHVLGQFAFKNQILIFRVAIYIWKLGLFDIEWEP